MHKQLNRMELIEPLNNIIECNRIEEEIDEMLENFQDNVAHPEVLDLIYYSNDKLSVDEIVDKALSYKPIQL